jgi:hypothetical protein
MSNTTDTPSSHLDVSELDTLYMTLEKIFSSTVKKYNKLQLSDHSNQTIIDGKILMKKGMQILTALKSHANALEILLSDCDDFIQEVTDDLAVAPRKEDFVFHTSGGMLSYPGRETLSSILAKKITVGKEETQVIPIPPPAPVIPIERTLIPELGYYLKLPVVTDLKLLPSAMYFFKGDKQNPPGIYMNILNGNTVRIPFPEIIDSKKEYDRTHSIRCKYNKREECNAQRSKMSKLYNSAVRVCNFAHAGDKIVKIGYPSRCPNVPDFGNPQTMSADVKKVTLTDVQNMMLYGLNDLISSIVWLDYNAVTGQLMTSLDKA